jgi:hypothetical protein
MKKIPVLLLVLVCLAPVQLLLSTNGIVFGIQNVQALGCNPGDTQNFSVPNLGANQIACTNSSTGETYTLTDNGTATPGLQTNVNSATGVQDSTTCSASVFSWSSFFNSSCWGPLLSATISGALVYVTSWILTVAGLLFNWALAQTVTQFGSFVNGNVITGINTAWSAFRDISNIVIIGMFTFIAIATILGNTEYGYKKMLSRVLIVAILINFSLLFTKIIIDASNFTATQFANAAGNVANGAIAQTASEQSSGSTSNTANSNTSVNQGVSQTPGIAGAFMKYSGVSSFGDTAKAVYNLGKNPQGSAWLGLLYGVVTAILFLVAAIVLFYGTFLLISRALLMIFLMITASIAFASHLLPSDWQSNYGWSMWWQTLLKNAIFAPLLMMFLWVTLTIGSQFNSTAAGAGGAASLGQLISSPTSTLNINALFGYIIVIGLLFISFRISSSFATSIGGFDFAAQFATGTGALLSRFGAAPLGRQIFGRAGLRSSDDKSAQLANVRARMSNLKADTPEFMAAAKEAAKLARQKGRADSRAHGSYNIMDTGVAKNLTKSLGLSGVLSGQTPKGLEGGIAGAIDRRVKEAAKTADTLAVSKDQQDAVRKEAISLEQDKIKVEKEGALATAKETAKVAQEQVSKANPEYAQAKEELVAATKEREKAAANHEQAIKELRGQMTGADPDKRALIEKQVNQSEEAHRSDMRDRAQKIETAAARTREMETQNPELAKFQKEYEKRSSEIAQAQKGVDDVTAGNFAGQEARLAEVGNEAVNKVRKGMEDAAKELGKREGNIWTRTIGGLTGDNERVGKATVKKYRSKRGTARIKEALKEYVDEDKGESGPAH